MKLKKRKKNSRQRGSVTHGWGARQRHRGSGCSGGVGMAGSGKRADHKKQMALDIGEGRYFGKQGFTSKGTERKKTKQINLRDIKANFSGNKIELKDHKILGEGEGFKAEIHAKSASKSAIEKMEKAGGKIVLEKMLEEDKSDKKKEIKKSKPKENNKKEIDNGS